MGGWEIEEAPRGRRHGETNVWGINREDDVDLVFE